MNKTVYFTFLDALRQSGVTNMLSAAPYLCDAFSLNSSTAVTILQEWLTLKSIDR